MRRVLELSEDICKQIGSDPAIIFMLLLKQSNFSNWKGFYEKTLQRVAESGAYYVLTVCALASCFYIIWLTPFSLMHSLSPNVS